MIKSGAAVDHGLHTIADDDQHVAILGDLPFVGHASVSGNDHRAAVLVVLIHGPIEYEIQRPDFALQATAIFYIDEWILRRREDITSNNDIGPAEVHHTVAVGDRIRQRENLDRLFIVILSPTIFEVRIAGRRRRRWLLILHSCLYILVADDGGALPGVCKLIREK